MGLTVFSTTFDEFCRAYCFTNLPNPGDPRLLVPKILAEKSKLFEQLMLFDKVALKVFGENAMAPLFINIFGLKAFEELLEQNAIGFTLWTPLVAHLVDDRPGVHPLVFGTHSSPAHSDPEQSVKLGLKMMQHPLPWEKRRNLSRKLVNVYSIPSPTLSRDAVGFTNSAYQSGKLSKLAMVEPGRPFEDMAQADRATLNNYATHLLEYRYLLESQMTSLTSYDFFSLFRDTAQKVKSAQTVTRNFQELAKIENVPDMQVLQKQTKEPFQRLPALRSSRSALKFRHWMAKAAMSESQSISDAYLSALEEAQGFFQTTPGRFVKTIAVSAIGLAVGSKVGGAVGAAAGAAGLTIMKPLIEPLAGTGWDLLDEFVLNGITKGWTPRMIFNDLRELSKRDA